MNEVNQKEVPCPSCGFYTIGEITFGSYNICDICGWEDDGVQLANPAAGGGANKISLIESQMNILEKLPIGIDEHKGFRRDTKWRPLDKLEINKYEAEKAIINWKNYAVEMLEDAYWNKSE